MYYFLIRYNYFYHARNMNLIKLICFFFSILNSFSDVKRNKTGGRIRSEQTHERIKLKSSAEHKHYEKFHFNSFHCSTNFYMKFLFMNIHCVFSTDFRALKKEMLIKCYFSSYNFKKTYLQFLDYMGFCTAFMITLNYF